MVRYWAILYAAVTAVGAVNRLIAQPWDLEGGLLTLALAGLVPALLLVDQVLMRNRLGRDFGLGTPPAQSVTVRILRRPSQDFSIEAHFRPESPYELEISATVEARTGEESLFHREGVTTPLEHAQAKRGEALLIAVGNDDMRRTCVRLSIETSRKA